MSTTPAAHTYRVVAATNGDGTSTITTKQTVIRFDSSPSQGDELPGPADLLTGALAACVLKNVERFGHTLGFAWRAAHVDVEAERQDAPPKITRMHYRLEIDTDETDQRVDLLHRNIRKHGTITNTLVAVCEITGEIVAIRSGREVGPDRLPDGLEFVRTATFDNDTAPAGLRRAHRVADGVWALLVVQTGALRFVFEADPDHPIDLTAGNTLAIPPGRLHHVKFDRPVTFDLEFHREPEQPAPAIGEESTGLAPS